MVILLKNNKHFPINEQSWMKTIKIKLFIDKVLLDIKVNFKEP